MKTTTVQIYFYSEIKQDDVVINLQVRYEKVEEGLSSDANGFYNGTETTNVAQFLQHDVTILGEILDYKVAKEFYDQFEGYAEEIQSQINEEIN